MEVSDMIFSPAETPHIITASGNKVCKNYVLCGSQNIMINGKVSLLSGILGIPIFNLLFLDF